MWSCVSTVHYYVDLVVICDPGQRHVLCLMLGAIKLISIELMEEDGMY